MPQSIKTRRPELPEDKAAPQKSFKEEFVVLAGDVKKSLFGWVGQFEKFKDIVKNNYELGNLHLNRGNLKDALLRFKFVLWLNPLHTHATYSLGATYMAMGDKKNAALYLRKALKMRPSLEEAKYLLSLTGNKTLTGADMPLRMPLGLAREFFDGIAPGYTRDQIVENKYEGHNELDNTLRSCTTPGRIDYVILELGCGTGLCGPGVRDFASHLTGVDISQRMLEETVLLIDNSDRKIYDALIRREAVEFMSDNPEKSYDAVMSAGMFGYIGDLDPIFSQVQRVLKDGGLFAFTVGISQSEDYVFEPATATFCYSQAYLGRLASKYGLKELRLKEATIADNEIAWVCVYQK